MQEITMSVRMIPLEGLFNKMRRLVRDLARKFGKKINLTVIGQETEMDRNVIEEIADPLVHIIRNAIDHGIEDGETRKDGGKDDTGTVSLSAKYEGNEIWISIKDDGAGLDRKRILAKAEERELLKADAETLQDEEVWQFLFEPGFSTAAQVSEVSGRGVGMDVVKRNIESLRGKIDISSTLGGGTEIILKIPLTLAIIDGITLKVGNVLYAIPLGDILEFHKASDEQVTKTDARSEVLRLREEIIPVIKLHEFFQTQTEKIKVSDGILIITQGNGNKAALLVDEIEGYQQIVVKTLPTYLGSMRAISGCSIMGTGEVTLIIDTGSLLKEELD
jgi:two-component system chemotaxis sensor kinase CheA